jgi:N-acetylmuramic acid 6-phosphate etherase
LVGVGGGARGGTAGAEAAVDRLGVGDADVLVALSASGATPYALGALRRAKARGALTVGIASNPGTPLLDETDHAVLLATPPEVIAGSTRMNAGTAQKCALNALSTLVALRLGHAYDGLMVNMRVENSKLVARARAVVMHAAGVDAARAEQALAAARHEIKPAILLCAGAAGIDAARIILKRCGGDVRVSLAALATNQQRERSIP